jgi:hypothetical protein
VVDPDNTIRHAEYVKEVADHPELRSRAGRRHEFGAGAATTYRRGGQRPPRGAFLT